MGEAIARFRDAARVARELSDTAYYCPDEGTAATLCFYLDTVTELIDKMNSGGWSPSTYAYHLLKDAASIRDEDTEPEEDDFAAETSVSGLLVPARPPDLSSLRSLSTAAVCEAMKYGPLATAVEKHINSLMRSAEDIDHEVSGRKTQWAETPHVEPKTGSLLQAVFQRLKRQPELDHAKYASILERWFDAYNALNAFAGEPLLTAVPSEKKTGSSRTGRPHNDEDLARDLLAGWQAFEPEEGRRRKRDYLAQRADVRVLKSEDARRRKIDSLLVALNSALHLRNAKTKAAAPRMN